MNILFVIGNYPGIGGTERVTTVLANEFSRLGHHVTVASYVQSVPDDESGLLSSIKIMHLRKPNFCWSNLHNLCRTIENNHIDLLINQYAWGIGNLLVCRLATMICGVKQVHVFHLAPNQATKVERIKLLLHEKIGWFKKCFYLIKLKLWDFLYRSAFSLSYFFSDRCVVLSERDIFEFKRYAYFVSGKKLLAISNPLVCSRSCDILRRKRQLLYVGRLENTQKRVDRILNAWRVLALEFPDWTLCIVGDGPDAKKLQKIVQDNDIPRVFFSGFVNPAVYYAESELLLLTSEYESFGLVILEAMVYGVVPIVYGNYAAVDDIITDGKDGVIVRPPFSLEKFSTAMAELMRDSDRREQLRHSFPEKLKKFDLVEISKVWLRLFSELLLVTNENSK